MKVCTTLSIFALMAAMTLAGAEALPLKSVAEIQAFRKANIGRIQTVNPVGEKEWGVKEPLPPLPEISTKILYLDDFANLKNWFHEGIGFLSTPEPGIMQINCLGSKQGAEGCMAFCRTDFPDDIAIEYEMKALSTRGLLITFLGARGRRGEDIITGLPPRRGIFADYINSEHLRCYHLSVSRYDDNGKHTGTSNFRRNPGFFLMAGQEDLCKEPQTWYKIVIYKQGGKINLTVNGVRAGGFTDPGVIPEPIPVDGKVGFRAIGSDVLIQIRNFKVSLLK